MVDLVQCKRKHINGFMLLLCCTLKCFPMQKALEIFFRLSLFRSLFCTLNAKSTYSIKTMQEALKLARKTHWISSLEKLNFECEKVVPLC